VTAHKSRNAIRRQIRFLLLVFVTGLVFSGATAIPLESELNLLVQIAGTEGNAEDSGFTAWLLKVRDALVATKARYPFIAYGTDWLAFAHFVIAIPLWFCRRLIKQLAKANPAGCPPRTVEGV
jgi:hypothetical protein